MDQIEVHTHIQYEEYSGQLLSTVDCGHIFIISAPALLARIQDVQSILSPQELEKAKRFVKHQDQENFIARKYALRYILGNMLKSHPRDINYTQTANKKPALTGLEFNSSHSGAYIAIAISNYPIGIDIEEQHSQFDYEDIVNNCFSAEEAAFINSGKDVQQNFYTLWTRKEALIKATGEGLSDQLNQIPSVFNTVERHHLQYNIYTFQWLNSIISIANSSSCKSFRFWTL